MRNKSKSERKGPRLRIGKIDRIIIDIQKNLRDSYQPMDIENLTAYERKRIHSFFDNKPEYKTRTYRVGDKFIFRVYPVENLKKFAEQKAKEALETGNTITLPPMSNYERYIVHDSLKDWEGIETCSFGEGENRRVEIRPQKFGRTLKKIIKKIKIF